MNETRSTLALLLALVVPTTILACSQSGDGAAEDSALQYGERLQQVRTLSQQHQAEVHQASAPEDIADAEHRYADQMEPHLARMEQLLAEMDGCSGAAAYQRNVATLRDDHLALQAMHQADGSAAGHGRAAVPRGTGAEQHQSGGDAHLHRQGLSSVVLA